MFNWQPYRRGWGAEFAWPVLMLLASHVVSASYPLPPISTLSDTLAEITAFSNSCAGLPPGFCGSDCFMCAFFYSVNLDLSPRFYRKFFISSSVVFTSRGFIVSLVSTYHICLLLCLFSLAVSPSFSVSFPALSDCYSTKPVHFYTFAITLVVKTLQTCTRSLFKHVKAKDRNNRRLLTVLLLKKHLIIHACFWFSFMFFSIRVVGKEWLGSFDMRALICLNAVPYLTQASRKSVQIGEPGLDKGHNMAVNHR